MSLFLDSYQEHQADSIPRCHRAKPGKYITRSIKKIQKNQDYLYAFASRGQCIQQSTLYEKDETSVISNMPAMILSQFPAVSKS